jgi:hypothetical protein
MQIRQKLSNGIMQWLNNEREPDPFLLSDFSALKYSIRPCDILLVEGRTRVADIIKTITQSKWTHAGIYVGSIATIQNKELQGILSDNYGGSEQDQLIVEGILGKGTIVTNIDEYEPDNLRICRPNMLTQQDAAIIVEYIIRKVGSPYDFRQMLDLARFLFPWSFLPRRWRSTLFSVNPSDSTKAVCSTLIAEAFNLVSYPILPKVRQSPNDAYELIFRNPRLYTPADYDYSPFFDILKFAKRYLDEGASYQRLPWNKSMMSNDE